MSQPSPLPRKQINLYQEGFRPARVVLPTRLLLVGGLLFSLILVLLYVAESWQVARIRDEAQALTARAEQIERQLQHLGTAHRKADPAMLNEAEKLEGRTAALQRAQEAIAAGELGGETGYSAQFRALSRATVPGAWLTGVDLARQGHDMNLSGRSKTGEEPARLIAALREQPLFVGLSYAFLQVQPPQKDPDAVEGTRARYLEFSLSTHLPKDEKTSGQTTEMTLPATSPGAKGQP